MPSGGKRKGSGRNRLDPDKSRKISITVSPGDLQRLNSGKKPRSEAIREALHASWELEDSIQGQLGENGTTGLKMEDSFSRLEVVKVIFKLKPTMSLVLGQWTDPDLWLVLDEICGSREEALKKVREIVGT